MVKRSKKSLTRLAAVLIGTLGLTALAGSLVFGQEFSAAMLGVVRDPTGAVLPGVSITAKHIESGLTRTVIANEAGSYRMPALPVGAYEVTAELAGFKQQVRRGINLVVTQEAVVNFTLEIGDLKENVTVTEDAPLVNTTLSPTSGLVTREQIKDLPLNGRSFLELMTLNAGVITNRSNTTDSAVPSFSIAGKRPDSNRFTMNGMDYVGNNAGGTYTAPQGISGFLLGVDAVREFNVLGHTYGAEYGKRAGAQVTIVTTSGTNQWRGSVFEFLRNNALDTRNFFDVANAPNPTPVPQFQRNQFGGAVGGPIRKDKMFLFGNYEGFRERLGVSQYGYVPSLQVRQGLWPNAAGQYVQAPNLEPRMLPFFRYWPEPNGPEQLLNGLPTGTARYSANPKRSVQEDFGLGRYDYYLSSKDSVNGNFTADKGNRSNPLDPTFLVAQETNLYTLSTQETHIFSPTLVNVANFGYSSARAQQKAPPVTPFPDGLLFLSGGGRNNPGSIVIGGGGVTVGASALFAPNGQNLNYNARRNFSVSDDLKLTKGIHSFSFGAWFQRVEQTAFSSGQNNAGTVTYPTLLAFLQDLPTQFTTQTKPTELIFSSKQAAWYFQDEMKLRPNLTVRLGLRDEMVTRPLEKNGHSSNYLFDANGILMTDPLIGKTPLIENHAKALLQPRVGLAWDVTGSGKWAVRAGFGIHNDLQDNLANRLNANPPFSGRLTFNTPGQHLLSIIPVSAESAPPPACKFVGQTNPPCSVYAPGGIDPALHTPTLQQWSLTVQHQLAQDLVAEVEYVGSQSYHVSTTMDVNTIQPLKCDNPAGCLAGGVLAANQRNIVPQGTLYVPVGSRPNPLLGNSQGWYYVGTSSYHAMNLSLLKRASRGLTFKTTYTWGKVLDINSANLVNGADNENPTSLNRFNRNLDKGPASFSLLHQFSTNFSYQLPFGNGKAFGSGATGLVEKLIGGWQWNSIFTVNSGFPITPQVGSNRSGSGDTGRTPDRPNWNPDFKGNAILGVDGFKKTGRYFDPDAFSVPLAGTFGNVGRDQLRGPGMFNVDTSFFKRIPLKERLNLQFRTEIFNVLNHPNFGHPNLIVFSGTDISPTAGVLTGTATSGNGRQIQLALRLEF
jgi:hypothetical protein